MFKAKQRGKGRFPSLPITQALEPYRTTPIGIYINSVQCNPSFKKTHLIVVNINRGDQ